MGDKIMTDTQFNFLMDHLYGFWDNPKVIIGRRGFSSNNDYEIIEGESYRVTKVSVKETLMDVPLEAVKKLYVPREDGEGTHAIAGAESPYLISVHFGVLKTPFVEVYPSSLLENVLLSHKSKNSDFENFLNLNGIDFKYVGMNL